MAKANTLPVYNKNGYYILTVRMGEKMFDIASRGYKVQSWVNFEESLKLTCIPREVTKEQYDAHYAYTPDNDPKKRKIK